LLITQSSWLLTLSPNCQITIPKSFQTHTFAFRRGNLHSYLLSPFQGAQRYEVFRFVKSPLYSPPHILTGRAKVRSFSLCQVLSPHTPLSSLRGATKLRTFWHLQASLLSKTHSPLGGSAKVRSFSLCQAPLLFSTPHLDREGKGTKFFALSSPFPSHPPLLPQRGDKVTNFLAFASLPTLKDPFPAGGERKGTKFFALSSPPSIPPRFLLGSAKVLKMRQLGFAACCR